MNKTVSYESASTPVWKLGIKIFGYCILAGLTSLFLYFSMTMLIDAALQEPVAYRIYEAVDGKQVLVEEMTWDEYTAMDPSELIVTDDSRFSGETVMAPINAACEGLLVLARVLEQGLMIAILVMLTGYYVYVDGDRDRNLVKHHEREATPLKGLQVGLVASIPGFFLYGLLIAGKCGVMAESVQGLFRFAMPCFLPLTNAIMPTAMYPATEMTFTTFAALFGLLLILPIATTAAYLLGYHRVLKKKKKK